MKWQRGYRSGDVIDRRGQAGVPGRGLGLLLPLAGRFGWKGILILLGIILLVGICSRQAGPPREATDEAESFVGFVLDDVQGTWRRTFEASGRRYEPAKLVLYSGGTETRCGFGSAAVGPFYCPNDGNVYIDLTFFRELRNRFGAPGDFAQAYVIAHEVGHHVQDQLGIMKDVERASLESRTGAGGLGVRLELQADCLAGMWARSTNERNLLEPGDIDEAMRAAAAVGDDTLERSAGQAVQPETWTHGSAQQRVTWFRRGYDSGSMAACDTFAPGAL